MGYHWDIFGISLGYLWDIFGISLGYPWDIFGISLGHLWDIFRISLGYLLSERTSGVSPVIFVVVVGQILYQTEGPCFWSTEAPPKTDDDRLFAPAVDDHLTEQIVF